MLYRSDLFPMAADLGLSDTPSHSQLRNMLLVSEMEYQESDMQCSTL